MRVAGGVAVLAMVVAALAIANVVSARSAGPSSLAPSDYRTQANAICARSFKTVDGLPDPKSVSEFARQLAIESASFSGVIRDIRRLDAPSEWKGDVARLLDAWTTTASLLRKQRQALLRRDMKAIQAVEKRLDRPGSIAARLGFRLGLNRCTVVG